MKLFLLLCCLRYTYAVIYHLNESEHERMPKLHHLDPYEKCLQEPGALYCFVKFTLVSDTPSPLMEMIEAYSEDTSKHFNYTNIMHGICVKQRCKEMNSLEHLPTQLEACLNKTLWEEYKLKAKVTEEVSCNDEEAVVDAGDKVVAVLILVLMMMNILGTLYDVIFMAKDSNGIKVLLYFSIRRNFNKLINDPFKKSDPRLRQLKSLNGIRTISTVNVILMHSLAVNLFADNPQFLEQWYVHPFVQIIVNSHFIMQTFFIISGILLVYNYCLYVEKHGCHWIDIVKECLKRWLRLTPAYAVVLAFTATWMRHLGSGPLWHMFVNTEVMDCRQHWWRHLVYINNYFDKSYCMIQSWYLAAIMQLFLFGIIIVVLCQSKTSKIISLSTLFVAGMIIPALHTYYQDLDGTLIGKPEVVRNLFIVDKTFNNVYKRGHTNLLGYVMGLILGNLLYHWNDLGINLDKYKKFRVLYWLTIPMVLATVYTASIFYADRPRPPILFRTGYSALAKPVYCCVTAVFIMGVVLKFENVYRRILEWNGWMVPSKLCYSAYLLHVGFIKYFLGIQTSILKATLVYQVTTFFGLFIITFACAVPFWLLVEAPLEQLVKTKTLSTEKNIKEKMYDSKSE